MASMQTRLNYRQGITIPISFVPCGLRRQRGHTFNQPLQLGRESAPFIFRIGQFSSSEEALYRKPRSGIAPRLIIVHRSGEFPSDRPVPESRVSRPRLDTAREARRQLRARPIRFRQWCRGCAGAWACPRERRSMSCDTAMRASCWTHGVDLATISERMGHSSVRTTADITATRSVARTARSPRCGTRLCSDRVAR